MQLCRVFHKIKIHFQLKFCSFYTAWWSDRLAWKGSLSVTDSQCPSRTVSVCHRQSVSITEGVCLSQSHCVCHIQSVSVTYSLCLTESCCLSQKFFFLLLSEQVCVCHRHYIILNNGILKSNCTIFPRSEVYITQYTP